MTTDRFDGQALRDAVGEGEVRHVGPAPWAVHSEEAQAGHRDLHGRRG